MKLNRIESSSDFKTDDGMFTVIADNTEYHLIFNERGIFNHAISLEDCKIVIDAIYHFISGGVARCKVIDSFPCLPSEMFATEVEASLAASLLSTAGFLTKRYFVDFRFDDVWDITADEYADAVRNKVIFHPEEGVMWDEDFEVFYTLKATEKMIAMAEWRENNKPQAVIDLIAEIKALESKLSEKKAALKAMGYHHE